MSTRFKPNVRILAPTHVTEGPVYASLQFDVLSLAAPPIPAPPTPPLVSCHKGQETDTFLRTCCTKTPSFAHLRSKTDLELTAPASCYESPCKYPVTRREKKISKLVPSGQSKHFGTQSIPCRYPNSETFAAGLRNFWTLLGPFWTEWAPLLCTCAAKDFSVLP